MSNSSTGSVPLKILWQVALVAGLVVGAWVLGQILPLDKAAKSATGGSTSVSVKNQNISAPTQSSMEFYQLPRLRPTDPSAIEAINTKILTAQQEIILAARQVSATSILTNLKARSASGVSVITLLSPDGTVDFARGKLAAWLVENRLSGVYRDVINSASHIIVIDGKTLIFSDLPFSNRAYEPGDPKALQSASLGFVYIINDTTLASGIAKELKSRVLPQNKLL